MEKKRDLKYLFIAVAIAVFEYVWIYLCYGGLNKLGDLVSVSSISQEVLLQALTQHFLVGLPVWIILVVCYGVFGREGLHTLGFVWSKRSRKYPCILAAAVYFTLLVAALWQTKHDVMTVVYQWVYYVLFVALLEEIMYRGLMPLLLERTKLPELYVWIVPGILFAMMHTVMPLIRNGFDFGFLNTVFSSIGGYTLVSCGFYFLRRWSGSLWLPILIHAAFDFSGILL